MKTNKIKCIFAIATCLSFSSIETPAQGNLLNNTNWVTENYFDGLVFGGVDNRYGSPTYGSYVAQFAGLGGNIYQRALTIPGNYYVLKLLAVKNNGTNDAWAYLNGGLLGKLNFTNQVGYSPFGASTPNTNWESFSYTFQALSTSVLIGITYHPQPVSGDGLYYRSGSGSVGAISLTQVPEPSSVVLFGGGLAVGLIYYRRWQLNPPKIP